MAKNIKILSVELEEDDGLLVTFSDGTVAGYVVEELLELRPHREQAELASPSVAEDNRYKARGARNGKPAAHLAATR